MVPTQASAVDFRCIKQTQLTILLSVVGAYTILQNVDIFIEPLRLRKREGGTEIISP
jgi:hypothetical protein